MKQFITSLLFFVLLAGNLAAHLPNQPWAPPTVPATNISFGSGASTGGGYSVYNNNGNTVTVTGITGGATYHVAIFEYNGSTQPVHITSSYPTASFSTSNQSYCFCKNSIER
ncbi:hypothetical protein [Paraflavitalea speifideaquila]|uniref:hypothetical protein n=1 Tax=Paraflavitalea speifideaquila TaxID=3076558 RepID=UPI0028EDF76F|nr:hypothetical protein [Paraflavitalea speifideiaquila]